MNLDYCSRKIIQAVKNRIRHQRTYLIQIHEGCSMGCSYCAIQMAIGPLRNSKHIEAVIADINNGLDKGFDRIRLIGDSAGSYGLDIGANLGALLKRISQIDRPFSLELTDINPVFLKIIYEPVKELCAQNRLSSLYIPIQSGNDRVLSLMNRRTDMNKARQMLKDIRAKGSPGFKLGTSVIVGFPSETMLEFRNTIDICNDVNFDWIWCHGFSPRPGTAAAAFPGQLSDEEVLERVSLFKAGIDKKGAVILDFE